jgi:hypothetical protein
MKSIARAFPVNNKTRVLFQETSDWFLQQSLSNVPSGNYNGDHWLASFAVYALSLQ